MLNYFDHLSQPRIDGTQGCLKRAGHVAVSARTGIVNHR
jgi:hypothetical protein